MNLRTMIKRPSAFVPVAMSFAALAIVLVHIIMSGAAREADEGTAAHLWQLLMAAQIPIVAFFAIRWLPQRPRPEGAGAASGRGARSTCASLLTQLMTEVQQVRSSKPPLRFSARCGAAIRKRFSN